jgi:hypothetical protein
VSTAQLSKTQEIDRNLERFLEILPRLMAEHAGEYVLMRRGDVVGFFESALDAQIEGNKRFPDSGFSFQPIEETVHELGYFSYAVDPRKP